MSKLSITFLFISFSFAANNICLITPEDLSLYNKITHIQKAKPYNIEVKKVKQIVNKKIVINKSVTINNISTNKKEKNEQKISKQKIKIIKLDKMSLTNLLNYAIKHNLTTKEIGKLVIAKLKTNKKILISNLDIVAIKNTFLNSYSINDLKLLLLAIKANIK